MTQLRKWFSFSIRDILWLTVVVAVASGWYTQSLRWAKQHDDMLARQNDLQSDLAKLRKQYDSSENVLYNEHLSHLRTTRDLSKIIVDILLNEQAFAANRQKYLEPTKSQLDLAMHMFDFYDSSHLSTSEQVKRHIDVLEETHLKRAMRLEERIRDLENMLKRPATERVGEPMF